MPGESFSFHAPRSGLSMARYPTTMRLTSVISAFLLSAIATVLGAPKVQDQPRGGFVVEAAGYRATVAADGYLTNLGVGGEEFLLPGVDISRGTYFFQGGVVKLAKVARDGADAVLSEGPAAKVRYAFADTGMTWTVENRTDKPMHFFAILPESIDLAMGPDGVATDMPAPRDWSESRWFGEESKVAFSTQGPARQWGWKRNSTVWEVLLKARETRVIEVKVGAIEPQERKALSATKPSLGELRLASPRELEVFQRATADAGPVRIAGRLRVPADQLRYRLTGKDRKGREVERGWRVLALAADGAFAETPSLPAGGWYAIELEASKDGRPVATQRVARFGVGEVFVGAGQSNSTSCGGLGSKNPLDGRIQPTSGMVSTFDGRAWRIADDPQPGAHDNHTGGSFWPAFGDAMHARFGVPIGVAVTGHGGTSINAWKTDGELFRWTLSRIGHLEADRQGGRRSHPGFRALLWHQGESDAKTMDGPTYAAGLGKIIADMRQRAGWEFPWFVAHATYHPGQPPYAGVRAGQKQLWDTKVALEGPDTDVMVGDLRDNGGKGIHFSKKGLKVHGEAWADKVGDWLEKEVGK